MFDNYKKRYWRSKIQDAVRKHLDYVSPSDLNALTELPGVTGKALTKITSTNIDIFYTRGLNQKSTVAVYLRNGVNDMNLREIESIPLLKLVYLKVDLLMKDTKKALRVNRIRKRQELNAIEDAIYETLVEVKKED